MGISRIQRFADRQNKMAAVAKALVHPARLAIPEYILEHQTCICYDLVHELPLCPSATTQHLQELKQTRLVKGEIQGPKVNCCIDAKVWEDAEDMFTHLFARFIFDKDYHGY